MEQQALACLDMMDFDGKQQILQKLRSGADAAAWQRMALTLAGRYEPELYERLAGQPSPGGSGDGSDGEKAGRGTGQSAAGAKTRRRGGTAGMIEVWLDRTALTVRGHAGFSRYGSDIVCAAASMLAFALAEAVQAAGMKTPPVIESGCGRFRLEAFADGQEQARLDGMFETVRAGYRLLSARYPEHVRVLGERDPENMMQRPERRPLEGQKEEKDEKL